MDLLCWLSSVAKGYSWRRKSEIACGCCCGRWYQVGIMIEIPAATILADQFAQEVDFLLELVQTTWSIPGCWPYERTSFIPLQPYNPSFVWSTTWSKAAHAENGLVCVVKWPVTKLQFTSCRNGLGLSSLCQLHLSFVHVTWWKLDTAKMQEYANRALTECSTMEEVLELSKEYVNVD